MDWEIPPNFNSIQVQGGFQLTCRLNKPGRSVVTVELVVTVVPVDPSSTHCVPGTGHSI